MEIPFELEKKYPTCSADVIILNELDEILLTKRGVEPYKGFWILPGGHIKEEQPIEAAKREVYEEIGVEIHIDKLYGVYTSTGKDPRGARVTVIYVAHIIAGSLQETIEVIESKFFSKDNIPIDIGFHHANIIRDFFEHSEGQPIL
ncbi:MAG: NUDIX hydrolase [Candidatus Magasanikbacteria bacterium]